MTRSQRKNLRKTISLFVRLSLLILLFWAGIQPVFTDLFEEETSGTEEQITGYKKQRQIETDSLTEKISAVHHFAN